MSQQEVSKTYDSNFLAKHYDLGRFISFWGQDQKARKYAAKNMGLHKGDRILNVPCGPGMEFEHLLKYIGSEGKILALDYSTEMLRQARAKAEKNNWLNIEFVQADAAKMDYENEFDAAFSVLGFTVIPDWQEALERTIKAVKPSGTVAIIDGQPLKRFWSIFNRWVKYIYSLASATWGRDVVGESNKYLRDTKIKEFLFGGLFVLIGRK